ncbi:MAG: hypothetical protein IH950_15645 [Bacteroidetes bacterium]|nr:hypothetical protein [Bacteroidota bacterium]
MKAKKDVFVVCVNNSVYAASLEIYKIYLVSEENNNKLENELHIIDESGESYIYPSQWFIPIKLPLQLEKKL